MSNLFKFLLAAAAVVLVRDTSYAHGHTDGSEEAKKNLESKSTDEE